MVSPVPNALQLHAELCEDLPLDALRTLRREVRGHYDDLVSAQRSSELLSVDLAELLCARLEQRIDAAPSAGPTW